jgi:glutamate-5-semialdehyde dehydrogenase
VSDYKQYITEIGEAAKSAYRILATADSATKNKALLLSASQLRLNITKIIAANQIDMAEGRAKGLSNAMLDRLELNEKRIKAMADGLLEVAEFPDPVGREIERWSRPSGIEIAKVTVPLGVIGIIYESRPNVTADAGALCLKSGNAAILRGGSDSINSSKAIMDCLQYGLKEAGLPTESLQLIENTDREVVGAMLQAVDFIDVIVPRGGKSLTQRIANDSRIPTIQHLDGNCHIYVHKSADLDKTLRVIHNAKLRRTGVCGAAESLLLDAEVAQNFLPKIIDELPEVEVRGDAQSCAIDGRIILANADDWGAEYLDKIISVKIVASVAEAIAHINKYGSHHTDCIMAEQEQAVADFLNAVDSAIVMQNTSTQFADGGEFGMGAEIGISTGRLHARGPVGAAQLVTYKYIVRSDGVVRA